MEILRKNKMFLKKASPQEIEILNQITGGNIERILSITDFETAIQKYKEREKSRQEFLKSRPTTTTPRKQYIRYEENTEALEVEYMEKGIEFFETKISDKGSKLYKQLNAPRTEETLIINKMYDRLSKKLSKVRQLQENGGSVEEIFISIQEYYKLCYTGALDSIGSYTTYLLLVFSNASLNKVAEITGVHRGGLTKVRNGSRWESLHEDGFLTEEEKAEAIKDFKEIAPLVSTKYDLTLSAPIEKRKY